MPWQIAAAGVSALGGLIQQNQNKKLMREQMRYNTSEREASQAFTTSEREAQQSYQTSEREAQNLWSEQLYNQYQSPEALRRQYSAAGLDPALAISGAASPAASSGSSGSAPSGASSSPGSSTPPYQNMNAFSQGFADIANAAAALAQAKKAGVETDNIRTMFEEQMRGIKLSNDAQSLQNSVNYKYLDKHNEALLKRVIQEYSLGTIKAEEMRSQIELLAKQNLIKQNEVDHWIETYENSQANIKSNTAVNLSSRNYYDALTSNTRVDSALKAAHIDLAKAQREYTDVLNYSEQNNARLRDALVDYQEQLNRIKIIEADIKRATSDKERSVLESRLSKEKLEFDRDSHYIQYELRGLDDILCNELYGSIHAARRAVLGR